MKHSSTTPEIRRAEHILRAHGVGPECVTEQRPRPRAAINAIILDIQAARIADESLEQE